MGNSGTPCTLNRSIDALNSSLKSNKANKRDDAHFDLPIFKTVSNLAEIPEKLVRKYFLYIIL